MKVEWCNCAIYIAGDIENDPGAGKALRDTMEELGLPIERVGNTEPPREEPSLVGEIWAYPVLFKRAKTPKYSGGFFFKTAFSPYATMQIDFRQAVPAVTKGTLLTTLSDKLDGQLSIAHRLRPADAERLSKWVVNSRTDGKPGTLSLLVPGSHLKDGIPDLFWQTILGPEYLALVGEQPARRVQKRFPEHAKRLSNGSLCIQLTETLEEFADASERELSRLRKAIKLELAADIFYVRADDEKG